MKTFFLLLALISSNSYAQSILLEKGEVPLMNDSVELDYQINAKNGRAVVRAQYRYGSADPEMSYTDMANFVIEGLSYKADTKEVIFDNGVNTYVCAKNKFWGFKPTGLCSFDVKYEVKTFIKDDGLNTTTIKKTFREMRFVIDNNDLVEREFKVKKINL